MVAPQVVETIRAKVDIVSVIGRYVELTKTGKNYKGLCPFHAEKTPSFNVNPDGQFYHCFGCHAGGDVFEFLMQIEGIDFPEAVRRLGLEVGIQVASEPVSEEEQAKRREYRRIAEMHELAAEFFSQALFIPDAAPSVGMLMFGNLLRESGVVERISKTAQNELMNIITIFLGVTVGSTASADTFLKPQTLFIVLLGLIAFSVSTAGGVLFGKLMCKLSGGKINPLIGSAGVSAVPMAARVSQVVGQKENPGNFLLMHAMGPNVAGVIGSAVAAGVFLSMYAK